MWADKVALIVGVPSHFQGGAKEGIEIDLANMANLFSGYGFKIDKLIDESATTEQLRQKLKKYSNMSSSDTFVFYYSGHGAQIPDGNGDESDQKDEVIVLYDHPMDGSSKGLFVDDEMFNLLTQIPAQKFVFFDSCHSGSAFKANTSVISHKSLGYLSKAMAISSVEEPTKSEKRSILFFGAAKDNQQSIATPAGSMFTLTLLDGIKRGKADLNHDGKTTFDELQRFAIPDIKRQIDNCPSNWGCTLFAPEMHGTDNMLSQNILSAMNLGDQGSSNRSEIEIGIDRMIENGEAQSMTLNTRDKYRDGELIELKFDSNSRKGYLTVITIDNNDISVLYPNKFQPNEEIYGGQISFPSDITNKFKLSAMKPYGRTVGYVLLSEKPMGLYDKGNSAIFNIIPRNSQKAIGLMRGMKVKKSNNMLIGKTVFTVTEGY